MIGKFDPAQPEPQEHLHDRVALLDGVEATRCIHADVLVLGCVMRN